MLINVTKEELTQLRAGDVIRNNGSANSYIVTANYGNRVTAVKTIDITNPIEWTKVSPVTTQRKEG